MARARRRLVDFLISEYLQGGSYNFGLCWRIGLTQFIFGAGSYLYISNRKSTVRVTNEADVFGAIYVPNEAGVSGAIYVPILTACVARGASFVRNF